MYVGGGLFMRWGGVMGESAKRAQRRGQRHQ